VRPVRAGGGLVWRLADGGPELLVVHRPGKDDWSFPKGKLERGETVEDAARREVEEETGFRCRLGAPLGTTSYHDAAGRPKTVWYWAMTPVEGAITPNAEADRMVWAPIAALPALLSYDTDRSVLERFVFLYDRGALEGAGGA
jgi:8-oxo-dGTP pyrophosphatase MutT (NUDIX family)